MIVSRNWTKENSMDDLRAIRKTVAAIWFILLLALIFGWGFLFNALSVYAFYVKP